MTRLNSRVVSWAILQRHRVASRAPLSVCCLDDKEEVLV